MFGDLGEITLKYELKEGRYIDAAVACEALLAWIDLARDAANAIDPSSTVKVELIGDQKGSLKQVLRLVNEQLKLASEGADEYPYLKKVAIGLAIAVATSAINVGVEKAFDSGVQEVRLSDDDREVLHELTSTIARDAKAGASAKRFFRTLEQDPAVTGVRVLDESGDHSLVTIPRRDFAIRGGLFSPEEKPAEQRRHEVWNVVLLQAPFYASSRNWRFSRDGLNFAAEMADAQFLQAIVDGQMPINLQEGVQMQVEVEWKEQLAGQIWEPMTNSRRITKVLAPRPVPPSAPAR